VFFQKHQQFDRDTPSQHTWAAIEIRQAKTTIIIKQWPLTYFTFLTTSWNYLPCS